MPINKSNLIPSQGRQYYKGPFMTKIARPKTENRLAAVEKRQRAIMAENREAAELVRKKSAGLKALRLLRDEGNS